MARILIQKTYTVTMFVEIPDEQIPELKIGQYGRYVELSDEQNAWLSNRIAHIDPQINVGPPAQMPSDCTLVARDPLPLVDLDWDSTMVTLDTDDPNECIELYNG